MAIVLGLSAFYHDSAAALIVDGEIVSAAQEERFTRIKHDSSFPSRSIEFVLASNKLEPTDIDYVAFYDKPFLKFERLLQTYVATAPFGFRSFRTAIPIWLTEKLFQKRLINSELKKLNKNFPGPENILFAEHHMSHGASAFYPSPFDKAIILTLDGVGEWATTTVAIGDGKNISIVKEIHFPHSLGLLYSAVTYYTGFKVNSGEYKVMGLAPYGVPRFKDLLLDNVIDVKEDGSYKLDMSYFNYMTGLTMTSAKFSDLFGKPPRKAEVEELTQFHMDVAASVQAVTEEVVLKMTRSLRDEYGIDNLCLAGGVALNCVANGKILRDKAFKNIWIQPAAGDAGGAIGAALLAYHSELGMPRTVDKQDSMKGSYLGPEYADPQIIQELQEAGACFDLFDESGMINEAATALAEGKAVGWFQGRMEFGPRALGGRSILGDPRSENMQKTLNLKVKFRESFRPFAPSVLREDVSEWFEHNDDSPYMLIVANINNRIKREMTEEENGLFGIEKLNVKRSFLPAITHVDYSARIQTIHKHTNPLYYKLVSKFKELTNCPVVVNTSFNVRGEPIVCTPTDAFRCFMGTDLDMLVIGNVVLRKERQDMALAEDYKNLYELD